jgi:hypothetical protein
MHTRMAVSVVEDGVEAWREAAVYRIDPSARRLQQGVAWQLALADADVELVWLDRSASTPLASRAYAAGRAVVYVVTARRPWSTRFRDEPWLAPVPLGEWIARGDDAVHDALARRAEPPLVREPACDRYQQGIGVLVDDDAVFEHVAGGGFRVEPGHGAGAARVGHAGCAVGQPHGGGGQPERHRRRHASAEEPDRLPLCACQGTTTTGTPNLLHSRRMQRVAACPFQRARMTTRPMDPDRSAASSRRSSPLPPYRRAMK